jgi:hypothetical protein
MVCKKYSNCIYRNIYVGQPCRSDEGPGECKLHQVIPQIRSLKRGELGGLDEDQLTQIVINSVEIRHRQS